MDSETDLPNGKGFGYLPQIFTNPYFAATLPPTETKPSDPEGPRENSQGIIVQYVFKKYERCWCNASDWDADPIDIEQPNSPTTTTTTD